MSLLTVQGAVFEGWVSGGFAFRVNGRAVVLPAASLQRVSPSDGLESGRTYRVWLDRIPPQASSRERHAHRRAIWQLDTRGFGLARHRGWWLVHNCVAHPLLGLVPRRSTVRLHDWTSTRLNREALPPSPVPAIPSKRTWLLHNVVAHTAIGVWPSPATFRLHDATAEAMNVEGWL